MSFIYAQDEPDKSVSFISNIACSQPRRVSVNGGGHQIKVENYNNVYSQNIKLSSDIACSHTSLQPQYPDFSKSANGHQPKPEPPLKFSSGLLTPTIPVSSQHSPLMQGYIPEVNSCMPLLLPSPNVGNKADFRKTDSVAPQPNDYCFTDGSVSPSISASHSTDPSFPKYQCLEGTVNLPQTPQMPSSNTSTETSLPPQTQNSFVSGPRTSTVSEALFVRIIVSRCKRIAPLWFRGISSMRERNREENRRTSTNAGQTQNDWSIISGKIREMNQIMETDTVVNLLKKLHKELPADSVLKFIKCWLGDADALNDPDSCVLSRPDAKGRMRRIDGGKGSDKVWRLDTIVGMLYHGLPMSSTDTNIMVHTCAQELCVRPQHIRFRASSVALVIVLKALAQAGYSIIPPSPGLHPQPSDESVDVFGPFSIEELQQYRSENLTPAGESVSRVPLNASDRDLAESLPLMKDILSRKDPLPPTTSSLPLSSSSAAAAAPINASDGQSQPVRLLNGSGVGGHDTGAMGIKQPFTATNNGQKLSAFLPNASAAAAAASSSPTATAATTATAAAAATPKRRSMKRPAQSSVMLQDPPPSAAAPPTASASSQTAAPASSALPDANVFLSISNAGSHPTAKQALSSAQLGDPQQLPTHFTTQPAAALIGCNHHAGVQPLYAPQPIGPPSVPPAPPAPLSGKSTPRQPAKKRLEARTPTIDELGVPSAFKVLHDTPFTPVLGRSVNSGQPTSLSQTPVSATISSTQPSMEVAGGGGVGAVQGVKSSSKPEEDEDEEMKTIFAGPVARRHHSTTHQPPLSGIPYVDYKQLHERLQHHGVAINGTAGAMDSANSLFFRSTPGGNVKRCASASALPSLSPGPLMVHGGQVDPSDLCQMPALVPAVPGFSSPPPPRLTPGGATGRQSKPPLFDRDTPGLRNLASRFRDSPIFHTHPDILDVLVSLAQEYGVQSNRAGSSCSRPQSQHYLRRSLFPGTDSPSPAGLPLNMLNSSGGLVGASDLGDSQQHPAPPPPPLSFTSTANSAFTDLSPRVVVEVMNPPPPASTADFN